MLAVRQDSLGDVLVTGPAIRALAATGEPVTLLCGPRGEAAARLLPGVDRVLVHPAPWIEADPPDVRAEECGELLGEVAALAPTEAVIFTSFHQSPLPTALLLRLAGVPRISAISVDYPGSLLDVRHAVDDEIHEVDRALSLAEAAGHLLPADDPGRLAVLTPEPPRALALPARPYLVVHPGASVPARAWQPERWSELVGILAWRGRQVVVTGARHEKELTARVAAGGSGAIDLGGQLDFGELAAVLDGAAAVAVANTGPAHLAAAVGTPVASVFAPTVPPRRWRPWGVPHELHYVETPCAGCRATHCPVPTHPCVGQVEPIEVADTLDRLTAAGQREEVRG
ncbi:MAG: glycosyltransferase family 9 protein [Actinobacteria bacterium]|nr:glycosyltransferase family 9 protein [Actinomycetota bacterium]